METDAEAMSFKLVKAAAKQAVRQGSSELGLPDEASGFLASQLSFTFDLLKKGSAITPAYLGILLAGKGLAIGGLAAGRRYDCAIAVAVLALSLTKTVAFTTIAGPGHLMITAAELLSDCYSVDKTCKVSEVVYNEVESVTLPAAMWLELGVTQWLFRGP